MKHSEKTFLSHIIAAFFYSMPLAAGTVGGGGPPARPQLEMELLQNARAALFTDDLGNIALGVRVETSEEIRLSSSEGPDGLKISKEDLKTMSDLSIELIDAVSLGNATAVTHSYRVLDGDNNIGFTLKDRRKIMREFVKEIRQ